MPIEPNHSGYLPSARRRTSGLLLSGLLLASGAIACHRGRHDRHAGDDATSGGEARIERELCLGQGMDERGIDVSGDGTNDLTNVFREGTRVCTAFDLNFDGRVDLVRFYEADGEAARLETHDFDFDGRIDQVALFENGHRVREELDTNFDDRADLLMWCEDGSAVRVQRDRLSRGYIDTWEDYERGYLREARYDEDGDHEPERFEYYRDGLLVAEGLDRDGSGVIEADERTAIEDEFAGRPQLMFCDPAQAEAAEAAAAAGEGGDPDAAPADAGVTPSPDDPAPWDDIDAGVPAAADAGVRAATDAGVRAPTDAGVRAPTDGAIRSPTIGLVEPEDAGRRADGGSAR